MSAQTAHYPNIVRIHDLESQQDDPDHPQSLINSLLYHYRATLKI